MNTKRLERAIDKQDVKSMALTALAAATNLDEETKAGVMRRTSKIIIGFTAATKDD